ncbi:MAG: RagB/SusD family nutrient uptake outer membrane protein [Marinifilaceae bacterium]
MRKNLLYSLILLLSSVGCSDMLNLDSTNELATDKLYENVDGAFAAMNGAYRALSSPGWTTSNREQAWGLASNQLAMDLMGEDMVQRESGNGWYYYHYTLAVREIDYGTSWTCYELWNMWYSIINQMNEIIAYTPNTSGDERSKNNVMAQAYSMRGFAYFNLIRWFQKTYVGNETAPGVPIYLTPANKEKQGNPRGTVEDVYKQINSDLDSAQMLFDASGEQIHKSHIDKYVLFGIKSRVAQVQEKWEDVAKYANMATQKPALNLMDLNEMKAGFNNISNQEWMWGVEKSDVQSGGYCSLWSHMDASLKVHAETSRKLISSWLYQMIHPYDVRRELFNDPYNYTDEQEANNSAGPDVRYHQNKFRAPRKSTLEGDYLYMRKAEMILNEAEAQCHLGNFSRVRELLLELVQYKYVVPTVYDALLKSRVESSEQTLKSTESLSVITLMDEVLLQRRIELWGEGFRMFDIIRLKSGMKRNYTTPVSNHKFPVSVEANSKRYVMLIPRVEFQGNQSLTIEKDQNPL